MPNTVGFDPEFRSENGEYDLARAKALLDLYGYVDRDGDGWRDQPERTTARARSVLPNLVRRPANLPSSSERTWTSSAFAPTSASQSGQRILEHSRGQVHDVASRPSGRLRRMDKPCSIAAPARTLAGRTCRASRVRSLMRSTTRCGYCRTVRSVCNCYEAKRLLIAYAPYKWGVHRIHTDIAQPWLHGYRRPPYWTDWWQYVDIDAEAQAKATK